MIFTYEVTYLVICGDDGLISHNIKNIREIIPKDKEWEEEENGEDED